MTTAERLTKVAEGLEKTQELNTELESIINGGDTGYKSYYHEFWDAYQMNGNRTNYAYAFYGNGWTNEIFHPKRDIIPTGSASTMFYGSRISGDLVEILEAHNVTLDLSKATQVLSIFGDSSFTRIGIVSVVNTTSLTQLFYGCSNLVTVDKLILRNDGANTFTGSNQFYGCSNLVNIIIEGVIGQSGFAIQYCTKLSRASIESIINALSTTTIGLTVTLSKTAVNNAFTTDEWNDLIANRSNWTISLI